MPVLGSEQSSGREALIAELKIDVPCKTDGCGGQAKFVQAETQRPVVKYQCRKCGRKFSVTDRRLGDFSKKKREARDWRSPELVAMRQAMGPKKDSALSDQAKAFRKLYLQDRMGFIKQMKDVEKKDSALFREREAARIEKEKTSPDRDRIEDGPSADTLKLIDRILQEYGHEN